MGSPSRSMHIQNRLRDSGSPHSLISKPSSSISTGIWLRHSMQQLFSDECRAADTRSFRGPAAGSALSAGAQQYQQYCVSLS